MLQFCLEEHLQMCRGQCVFFSLKLFAELFSFVFWWSPSRHLPLGGISKFKCSRKQKSKRLLPRLPPRLLLEAVWPIFMEVRIFIWPKSDVCLALSLSQKWSWIHAASPKVTQPLLDNVEFNCWICQNCYMFIPFPNKNKPGTLNKVELNCWFLSKWLLGFGKVVTCISSPLPNKTKLKFDQDIEAGRLA